MLRLCEGGVERIYGTFRSKARFIGRHQRAIFDGEIISADAATGPLICREVRRGKGCIQGELEQLNPCASKFMAARI
jgi:hypothetical protein